jgi:hypothetical protein
MVIDKETWNKMLWDKEVKDISQELPDSFLVIYQVMRAKIEWKGKKYFATGWAPPESDPYIELREA